MFETFLDTVHDYFERYRSRFVLHRLKNRPFIASDSLISGFIYRFFSTVNHKNKISNYPRAQQNHRNKNMAGSNVKEHNLKKNNFSRLKKTQKTLANKFMREFIVAVSKLNTKYTVMLIYASYCLSAVEANDNNQSDPNSQSHYISITNSEDKSTLHNVIAIVGSVVGILTLMLGISAFYFQHIKRKEEPTSWSVEQVDKMIEYLSKDSKDIEIFKELENLKNNVEKIENDQNLRKRPQSENIRSKV